MLANQVKLSGWLADIVRMDRQWFPWAMLTLGVVCGVLGTLALMFWMQ